MFFTTKFRLIAGRLTLYSAILSFVIHLSLIAINELAPHLIHFEFLSHPINAIYTPFSILLVFETYLLIYYLRKSTTFYIAKQYEIIALILIRGIFKDMTHLDLSIDGANNPANLELLRDLITVAVVFVLIHFFYTNSGIKDDDLTDSLEKEILEVRLKRFVYCKNALSTLLLWIFLFLTCYSLYSYVTRDLELNSGLLVDTNAIFFEKFFTILILSDVFILLFSLMYSEDFSVIIRNSSFVISTILLKMSFSADGWMTQLLILIGVGFGVLMLLLSNFFKKSSLD
jgi:hypothetical protein